MSMRVDQLAGDLTTSARTAEPALRESYLTALCGMLESVGERISPQVLSTTGSVLQEQLAATGMLRCSVPQRRWPHPSCKTLLQVLPRTAAMSIQFCLLCTHV